MIRLVLAWIKKYIFNIASPTAHRQGYIYEYDMLRHPWDIEAERLKWLEMLNQIEKLNREKYVEKEGEKGGNNADEV